MVIINKKIFATIQISLSQVSSGPSIYSGSKIIEFWVRTMALFADVQNCIYADIVGGWVGQKK